MISQTTVWARVQLEGWHFWPEAPPHRNYLASMHRHLFGVRADVLVTHDDRDVEFHDLQQEIRLWWGYTGGAQRGPQSCETMAAALAEYLTADHSVVAVTVDEDGEAGACVRYLEGLSSVVRAPAGGSA